MSGIKKFIIRVYGLIINSNDEILIAEEYHYNTFMRKFPGGGLEFGEGPVDCLKRELLEELQVEADQMEHVHTTDFFVSSAFNPSYQVVGIYFRVHISPDYNDSFREEYALPNENGIEKFRWMKIDELNESELTFPTDKRAFAVFKNSRGSKD